MMSMTRPSLVARNHDAYLETVAILSDPAEVAEIHQGLQDLENSDTSSLDEVRAALEQNGILEK